MKEQELKNLIDKSVGTKGPLKIPSFWMKEIFYGLMEWVKRLIPKIEVPINVSQLRNDANYASKEYVDDVAYTKQDELISGQTIKTIGGESILSSGNIDISYLNAIKEVIINGGILICAADSGTAVKLILDNDYNNTITVSSSKGWWPVVCSVMQMSTISNSANSLIEAMDFSYMKKITSMYRLCSCTVIKKIDLSMVDTSVVTDMRYAFYQCGGLKEIDLSKNDLSNVISMENAFDMYAESLGRTLEIIRLPNMRPTSMKKAFNCLKSLRILDFSQLDTSAIVSSTNGLRIYDTTNLETILLGPNYFKGDFVHTNFTNATKWVDDSVRFSLVQNLYDRASDGKSIINIGLSEETKAVLSEDNIATIISKGYTIQ